MKSLVGQSGLEVVTAYTVDSWTVPSLALLNFCRHGNVSMEDRGDNIILICKRGSEAPVEFPVGLYD